MADAGASIKGDALITHPGPDLQVRPGSHNLHNVVSPEVPSAVPALRRLWTDDENRRLVTEHYPWFLDTYDSLPKPVMKADASRYLYMHHIGGTWHSDQICWLHAWRHRCSSV